MTNAQATKQIGLLKKDLFNLRFKKINNQIDNPAQFNSIKTNSKINDNFERFKMTKKILKGKVVSDKNNKNYRC